MNPAIFQQPFFQVTLPLMVTFVAAIWIAQWSQNKRFDDLKSDMHRRLDDIRSEIRELRAELKELRAEVKYDHGQRILRLEERTSLVGRK